MKLVYKLLYGIFFNLGNVLSVLTDICYSIAWDISQAHGLGDIHTPRKNVDDVVKELRTTLEEEFTSENPYDG
jgi:hypothetical protein